jgi:hypothetical protein
MPDDADRLETLALAHLDNALSEDQAAELRQMLLEDDDARRRFVAICMQVNLSREVLGSAHAARLEPVKLTARRMLPYAWAAGIVLALGLTMSMLVDYAWDRHERLTDTRFFATMIDVGDAEFGPSDMPVAPGSQLRGGFLRVRSGNATIEFFSGARVTITGPATFGINSAMRGFLERGQILATVPEQAHGFTIGAPGLAVIDLGTQFGMQVDEHGATQVHVFEGRVELRSGEGPARQLAADEAVAIDPAASVVRSMRASRGRFELPEIYPGLLARWMVTGDRFTQVGGSLRPAGGAALRFADDAFEMSGGALFLDLNMRAGGPFTEAGLVDAGGLIGRPGTTVYLSWTSRATGVSHAGWGGLALFAGGDVSVDHEPLFVGKANHVAAFSYDDRQRRGELDTDPATPEVDALAMDTAEHRWVVRLEFRDGKDRALIWLDPPAGSEPELANAVVERELSFDHLRLAAEHPAGPWQFGDVRVGQTWDAVTAQITETGNDD